VPPCSPPYLLDAVSEVDPLSLLRRSFAVTRTSLLPPASHQPCAPIFCQCPTPPVRVRGEGLGLGFRLGTGLRLGGLRRARGRRRRHAMLVDPLVGLPPRGGPPPVGQPVRSSQGPPVHAACGPTSRGNGVGLPLPHLKGFPRGDTWLPGLESWQTFSRDTCPGEGTWPRWRPSLSDHGTAVFPVPRDRVKSTRSYGHTRGEVA